MPFTSVKDFLACLACRDMRSDITEKLIQIARNLDKK